MTLIRGIYIYKYKNMMYILINDDVETFRVQNISNRLLTSASLANIIIIRLASIVIHS